MLFHDFNLDSAILKAIEEHQYKAPTAIQEQAIPTALKKQDILGCAQTGTGKTAAFAIPILQRISELELEDEATRPIRALILAPTRELAIQIGESFDAYGKHLPVQTGVIFGGVTPKRHIKVLKRKPDILVSTPGRLLDLIEQGHVDLKDIQHFVLDEADQMLESQMLRSVKQIIMKLPKARQNMLFSATMPKEIMKLAHSILKQPVKIEVSSHQGTKIDIKQQVYKVQEPDKTDLLLQILKTQPFESVLVFVRTKKKADKVCKAINVSNIRTKAIHGDKNQSERQKSLELFKNKEVKVLVATDVAARGIDINGLSHVINMDIPTVPETYIHRIGRTGRAGMSGMAISFCSQEEKDSLKAIEKLQGQAIEVVRSNK